MPKIITKPTVCICGSRSIKNLNLSLYLDSSAFGAVIHGGANGVDWLVEQWCRKYNIEPVVYLPNYKIFGRAAPIRRDEDMVKACDYVIAFWDGQSSGTKYTCDYAIKLGKKVQLHLIEDRD